MLKDKKIKYKEGKPEEWFKILEEVGGTLTKEGIAKFSQHSWDRLGLPIAVENELKEWASPPQGNNLPKNILYPLIFSA